MCALPMSVQASVQMTEVMYNPDGSDTGAEWVELHNTENSIVSLKGWKFNDGSNHNIVDPSTSGGDGGRGTLTIPAGGFVILSNDPATFIARHSSFTGSVLKSALSLNNASATLIIVNDAASAQDTVSYTKDAGAADDGNSLHRSSSSLVAGAPSPGVFSGTAPVLNVNKAAAPTQSTSAPNTTSSQTSTSVVDPKDPPVITATATSDTVTVVGAGTAFSGQAYTAKKEPLNTARYIWNFGDGATTEGNKVLHTYLYPGNYVVTLTVANSYSTAQSQLRITAVPADIGLVAEVDYSLLLVNHSLTSLNVGGWMLTCSDKMFVIPENTMLLSNAGIRFSSTITGLVCGTLSTLNFPNGTLAAKASLSATAPERGEAVSAQAISETKSDTPAANSKAYFTKGAVVVEDFVPPAIVGSASIAPDTQVFASVIAAVKDMPTLLRIELIISGLFLLTLCVVCIFYLRRALVPDPAGGVADVPAETEKEDEFYFNK